jgi:hypothetical protein
VSKLNIVDLANEVELSSAAMCEIGGGISCAAGVVIAKTYEGLGDILRILGDQVGAANAYGKASGVLQGCGGPA